MKPFVQYGDIFWVYCFLFFILHFKTSLLLLELFVYETLPDFPPAKG